jgi:hypothetical protein
MIGNTNTIINPLPQVPWPLQVRPTHESGGIVQVKPVQPPPHAHRPAAQTPRCECATVFAVSSSS